MKITFMGATQTVTGSMLMLEVNGSQILLDCGLFQGRRQESFEHTGMNLLATSRRSPMMGD